ncbi:hypothetical protein F5Y18DRAFT_440164 [Xylariaceae sp. FL1019]|nr:hypothetical protein F5Y18DRAFT_440164 [Xylariaceae sp. FL1019]
MASLSNHEAQLALACGLELEFLIRPKHETIPQLTQKGWDANLKPDCQDGERKNENRTIMRKEIAENIVKLNVDASVRANNYDSWSIVDERTLDEREIFVRYLSSVDPWNRVVSVLILLCLGRVEIVSRALWTDEEWKLEIDRVYSALHNGWDLLLTPGCAMHTHVSPGIGKRFTLAQVKWILKWISLFDGAITKIMPAHRKDNAWAMSNFRSAQAPSKWRTLFEAIETESFDKLFKEIDEMKMISDGLP